METIKDNENPIIFQIEHKKRTRTELDPCKRWRTSQSTEDRAIREALNGHASLLEKCGLQMESSRHDLSNQFTPPYPIREKNQQTNVESYIQRELIDAAEVFEHVRNIQDPEHPLTLEQLNVVTLDHIQVEDNFESENSLSIVDVRFTPTVPHCSMATLIGLCIRVKLIRSIPSRFRVTISIQPGTHASEQAINKQLADKERVAAALENSHLLGVVNKCIGNGMKGDLRE
mmetsp:Transcript_22762/g.33611  ORF Transcript_22762/g.33611 Transcript_22762/m.33611 type:complete len:230 (+) Transcript_22762:34-723(+)